MDIDGFGSVVGTPAGIDVAQMEVQMILQQIVQYMEYIEQMYVSVVYVGQNRKLISVSIIKNVAKPIK